MRPSRVPALLLAALVFFHGLALGVAPARHTSGPASATAAAVGGGPQSVPLPEHDEATCAVCHGSVTLPSLTLARTAIPQAPASVRRGARLSNDRVPRSTAGRPTSSRAPPALRSA
jgi:hypothetical protein